MRVEEVANMIDSQVDEVWWVNDLPWCPRCMEYRDFDQIHKGRCSHCGTRVEYKRTEAVEPEKPEEPKEPTADDEPWRKSHKDFTGDAPIYKNPEKATPEEEEEFLAWMRKSRDWKASMLRAVSLGKVSPEEAEKAGLSASRMAKLKPLPSRLFHVTTALSDVMREGLKTRDELGQAAGKGLGGGASDTVSFTTEWKIAKGIYEAMIEARKVARGEITLADMVKWAEEGHGGVRPYIEDFMRYYDKTWKTGDPYPPAIAWFLKGYTHEWHLSASRPKTKEDVPKDWMPGDEGWKGGDGRHYHAVWWRPMTDKEKQEGLFDIYKWWSMVREGADGVFNPLFFGSDVEGLAAAPEEEIGVLELSPVNSKVLGYQVSALGEWRTFSGDAVKIDRVIEMEESVLARAMEYLVEDAFTKDKLADMFINKDDEFWEIDYDENDGSQFRGLPYSGVQCTGYACQIARRLPGRVKIYGFSEDDNPDSAIAYDIGGHDFAVVDDRFIVDPWLIEVEAGTFQTHTGHRFKAGGQGVFDLQDKADEEIIRGLYGDRSKWKRMTDVEREAFSEARLYDVMGDQDRDARQSIYDYLNRLAAERQQKEQGRGLQNIVRQMNYVETHTLAAIRERWPKLVQRVLGKTEAEPGKVSIQDAYWILPSGDQVKVPFWKHAKYVEDNPEQFNISPEELGQAKKDMHDMVQYAISEKGAIRMHYYYTPVGLVAALEGLRSAIRRRAMDLFSLFRGRGVKEVGVSDYSKGGQMSTYEPKDFVMSYSESVDAVRFLAEQLPPKKKDDEEEPEEEPKKKPKPAEPEEEPELDLEPEPEPKPEPEPTEEPEKEEAPGEVEVEVVGDIDEGGYEELPLEFEDEGVVFIGGDAVGVDLAGERHPSGYEYAVHHKGWALNKAGGTRLAKEANRGYKTVAVVVYPRLLDSMRRNPIFQEALRREIILKHGKRKGMQFIKEGQRVFDSLKLPKKHQRTPLGEAAKLAKVSILGTARKIAAEDFSIFAGKVHGVGRFKEVRQGDDRVVKHEVYPTEVIFESYQVLPKPIPFDEFMNELPEEDKRRRGRWVMLQQYNFTLHKRDSSLVPKLIAAGKGDMSLLQPEEQEALLMAIDFLTG